MTIAFLFYGCEKNSGDGNALVRVMNQGKFLEQASVYLKLNAVPDEDSYDHATGGDAIGEAYFTHLKPGTYYFLAKGFSPIEKTFVTGNARLNVKNDDKKEYIVVIDTN